MTHALPPEPAATPPAGPATARTLAEAALRGAGALEGGWTLRAVRRQDARTLRLELAEPGPAPPLVLLWSAPPPGRLAGPGAGPWEVAVAREPGARAVEGGGVPTALKRRALAACLALARLPGSAPVALRGLDAGAARPVAFDAAALERWLAPAAPVGGPWPGGWRLVEVAPDGPRDALLTFEGESGGAVRLRVRPRDDRHPAFARTAGLDVRYSAALGEDEAACTALAGELALRIEALEGDVRFLPAPEARAGAPHALNLALPTPCDQACAFCSLQTEGFAGAAPPPGFVEGIKARLRRAAAAGSRELRVNGIEPLSAPFLFELLAVAREAGFEEVLLLSTCRRLADPAFAERYLAAMPARYNVHVPLYGSRAEVHDAITGAPGAFDEVMAAIANLQRLKRPGGRHQVTTVLVRDNAADLAALGALVRRLGEPWHVHLAFPNSVRDDDPYQGVALSMAEALAAAYPPGADPVADLPLGEVLPCAALAHQRATGHRLLAPARVRAARPELAGTWYRSADIGHASNAAAGVAYTAPTARCPHRDACALAPACPGRVYTAYKRRFGLDALAPASRAELAALPDGEALLAALDGA